MATRPTGNLDRGAPVPEAWTAATLDTELFDDLRPGGTIPTDELQHDDGYWATTDNHQLYWQSWFDASTSGRRGSVALMHGYGEHTGRYDHVAAALVRAGYDVMALDLRGHGRSTGRRGYVSRFSRYVDDLALLKRRVLDRWPDRPLFVLGHSNGGLVALRYALRKPDGIVGFAVTSPLCRLAVSAGRLKKLAGRLAGRLAPKLSLPSELDPGDLSHIDEVVDRYRRDPLVFDVANTRWYTELLEATESLRRRAAALDQPFLFLVAGDDRVVDPSATESLFHRLGSLDRELEVFPDLYHEILNEPPWRTILRRLILWMERHRVR